MITQPPVSPERLAVSAKALKRFRVMAFVTGFVLLTGTILLILKWAGTPHMEPETGIVWLFHGYFYLVYVVTVAMLGVKLRWPLLRFVLVMAAGTIPTLSFVAEHFVTRDARRAADHASAPATDQGATPTGTTAPAAAEPS